MREKREEIEAERVGGGKIREEREGGRGREDEGGRAREGGRRKGARKGRGERR